MLRGVVPPEKGDTGESGLPQEDRGGLSRSRLGDAGLVLGGENSL